VLTTYKNPPKIPPQNIVQIFVDDFPGPTLGERARRNVVDWSFMRFYNIIQEKKKGRGRGGLGILNWTLHEAGAERNGPKFSEQPYSRSLTRCKGTNIKKIKYC